MTVVRVEGAAQLRRTLRKAGQDLNDLHDAHKRAANVAAAGGKAKAPVGDTGRLAGSVRGAGTKTAAIIRAGFAAVPYAPVIQWGWPAHNIASNPFLTEGAQDTEPQWFGIYREAFDKALNQVKGL